MYDASGINEGLAEPCPNHVPYASPHNVRNTIIQYVY